MRSIATPFNLTGGRVSTTTNRSRIAEQKIIDVLVTAKLERPTIPLYGAGLQGLLFENIDELVEADIKTDIGLDMLSSISGVTILDLKIQQDVTEPTLAVVRVLYQTSLGSPQILTFQLSTDILTEESPL
jgi:phage baseplate assembly protein W